MPVLQPFFVDKVQHFRRVYERILTLHINTIIFVEFSNL